jgi:hypothetical protein
VAVTEYVGVNEDVAELVLVEVYVWLIVWDTVSVKVFVAVGGVPVGDTLLVGLIVKVGVLVAVMVTVTVKVNVGDIVLVKVFVFDGVLVKVLV